MSDNREKKDKVTEVKPPKRMGRRSIFPTILILIVVSGMSMLFRGDNSFGQLEVQELTFNEFAQHMESGRITEIEIRPALGANNRELSRIIGTITSEYDDQEENAFALNVYNSHVDVITSLAIAYEVEFRTAALPSVEIWSTVMYIGTFVILGGVIVFMVRSLQKNNNKAFNFGNNKAKLAEKEGMSFDDVAGNDEEKNELVEIVDFLKSPTKYTDMGARIPKGILLSGPPGTGKTLLARAVAGEAGVPFYSISGSDFVEMFVGVGASRVREMFATAKKNSPCIIFIDEIDAVGRQRGTGMGGGHDEREQTLNQLLTEMDGFGGNSGVVIMAATNRPDVLDPALLRPGRFDRQVTIGTPDVKGRAAILEIHAKNKKLAPEVKLGHVAKRTPGFSGADLENLLNESALLAARDNRTSIQMHDIDEATDRVMMGPAKKSKVYTPKERKTVAYHEAGHVVVGLKAENGNIVHKVTIIPRGQAGGYAMMMPEEETYLSTRQDLLDRITGLLAGRVAEEITFGEITTGAYGDFQQATAIARSMVTEYGMSKLGPIQFERRDSSVFLGRDYASNKGNFSEQSALRIDEAIGEIIDECYGRCQKMLMENKELMELVAETLLVHETLTKEQIDELASKGKLEDTLYDFEDVTDEKGANASTSTSAVESTTDVDTDSSEETELKNDSDLDV